LASAPQYGHRRPSGLINLRHRLVSMRHIWAATLQIS
jgi:hypothetical protein